MKGELQEFTFEETETKTYKGKTPESKTTVILKKREVEAKGLLQLSKHGSMVKTRMDVEWSELLLLQGKES